MKLLNPSELVGEVASDSPCGPSIEYDPEFVALEAAAKGKEGVELGDNVIAPEPPDWRYVCKSAEQLLNRSRDLRLIVLWMRAAIEMEGWAALASGLATLTALIEQRWESLHPMLDEEDDRDPTLRINSLASLASLDFCLRLKALPLVSSKTFGQFGIREIEAMLSGEALLGDPNAEPRTISETDVSGAFAETPSEQTAAIADSITESIHQLNKLDQTLTDRVGSDAAMDFSALLTVLKKAKSMLLSRSGADSTEESDEVAGQGGDAGAEGKGSGAVLGAISSRGDVVKCLDAICAYYAKHEPSSPVPLVMKRAKVLVSMGFLDIVEELAPGNADAFALLQKRS